jgi:myxalamid-type polyketide synthase MxaE and MxaD
MALEHPEIWGGLIDLDPASNAGVDAAIVWDTIHVGDGEDQIAVRGATRFGARLTRTAADTAEPVALRSDGSYLVTGGFGGLGLRVARWLAANGAGHIVLISRRVMPDRALWSRAEGVADHAEAIAAILEIERSGSTVVPVAMDVASEDQQAALAARFGRDLPPLRGVLHLASAHREDNICDMTPTALEEMLRPKVFGTWALDRATRGAALDFFVLFSSTTGLLGSKGLAHYAAANVFLDSFAHQRRRAGANVLSINWGAWDVMQAGSAEQERMFQRGGLRPMASPRALAALGALLGMKRPQIAVAAADWNVLRTVFEARRRRPFLEELAMPEARRTAGSADRSSLVTQLEAARAEDRRDVLVAHVRAESAAVLGLDPELVDVEQGLFEMGMDSLMSVELKTRLEKGVGKRLPTTLTFNYPSVAALADFLGRELTPAPEAPKTVVTAVVESAPGAAVDDLSEEQLEALLAEKLAQFQ